MPPQPLGNSRFSGLRQAYHDPAKDKGITPVSHTAGNNYYPVNNDMTQHLAMLRLALVGGVW